MRLRRTYSLSGLHEVVFDRPDRRGGPGPRACLAEDVLDVVARRLCGDAEGLGDLLVGLSAGEREQDLELAVRQARGQLAWPFRHAVSGGGEHGVDRLWAQTALARVGRATVVRGDPVARDVRPLHAVRSRLDGALQLRRFCYPAVHAEFLVDRERLVDQLVRSLRVTC